MADPPTLESLAAEIAKLTERVTSLESEVFDLEAPSGSDTTTSETPATG